MKPRNLTLGSTGNIPEAPPEIARPVAQAIAKKLREQLDGLNSRAIEARRMGLEVSFDIEGLGAGEVVVVTISKTEEF